MRATIAYQNETKNGKCEKMTIFILENKNSSTK